MVSLPLKYGFTPKRWTKAIQIMLEKKPGNPLLHRLRGILILEADLNWVLRLIWGQRLFKNAVNTQTLMTTQQARPGFHSITAPLNKVLAYDHMRLTKQDGASFDNNAKGCYDRIVPPHALLCCRRMGLPKTAAQMMGEILQNTIYKLKTGHGISDRTYFSNSLRRILGSGQGSGASPCIWTLVLDPILSSVSKKFKCLEILTPSKKTINRIGDAFVDDTALFLTLTLSEDENEITPEYIATKLQEIAQDFERKLYSTGGSLSLPKCFWYLIHWK